MENRVSGDSPVPTQNDSLVGWLIFDSKQTHHIQHSET